MANLAPKESKTFELPEPVKQLRLTNQINGSITLIAAIEGGALDITIESVQPAPAAATPAPVKQRFVLEG